MINVNDLWLDVLDKINEPSNGQLPVSRFNRYLWLAQLRCMDWLSGDVAGVIPPTPYLAQKNKDWLSPFITPYPVQVVNGVVTKPEDYYGWENGYLLGDYNVNVKCDEDVVNDGCNIPIELLDGDKYFMRCNTFIEGLKPSFQKPIAKEIGNTFEFLPTDLGSITIEYYRLPVKAQLVVKIDTILNDEVYDPIASVNLEWSAFAEDVIAWFVADQFFNFVSNQAGKTFNTLTGKTVRDAK